MRHSQKAVLVLVVLALAATGCATKKYVRTEMETTRSEVGERMDGVETQVENNQSDILENEAAIQENEQRLQAASATARDAYDRAIAAGELAEGKFLYEIVLSSDRFRFAVDRSDLSDEARGALDEFADDLKLKNENVFIEIQGHTDSTGSEAYNMTLGNQRGEAVRRYLNERHGLALHRMSVISYGETSPVEDNSTRAGRALNRRVSLVVLQ